MNLNQLSVFYLAALHSSMSAAARELYVSPPAVTMQIKKLENWLGFSVFERGQGELRLTERGRDLYETLVPIFGQLENLERYLKEVVETGEIEVRLGFYHIAGIYFVPELIAHVAEKFPRLTVKMEMGTKDVLLDKLAHQQVDVILIIGEPPEQARCKSTYLFDEEYALVTSSEGRLGNLDSISVRDIGRIPLIMQQKGTGALRVVEDFFTEHGVEPNILLKNISSDVTKQFLPQMLSAAFVGRFIVQKEIDDGLLHEIKVREGSPRARYYLVYQDTPHLPVKIEHFLKGAEGFLPGFPAVAAEPGTGGVSV